MRLASSPDHVPPPFPPPFPPPAEPGGHAPLPIPMVYVAPTWEYKHLHRAVAGAAPPMSEAELNALGTEGWELTAVVSTPSGAHFYFKRAPE